MKRRVGHQNGSKGKREELPPGESVHEDLREGKEYSRATRRINPAYQCCAIFLLQGVHPCMRLLIERSTHSGDDGLTESLRFLDLIAGLSDGWV